MKKIIILIILFLLSLLFIEVPRYVELNDLVIVEGIGLECDNDLYKIYLKEVIPEKDDSKIEYRYKYYSISSNNLNNSKKLLEDKVNKKIYYKSSKYLLTNCVSSKELINIYKIKPKIIYHTNNKIKKELRDYP